MATALRIYGNDEVKLVVTQALRHRRRCLPLPYYVVGKVEPLTPDRGVDMLLEVLVEVACRHNSKASTLNLADLHRFFHAIPKPLP